MSYVGKTVTFIAVGGHRFSGVVTNTYRADDNTRWYELDSGWTVNEAHVVGAHWEAAK